MKWLKENDIKFSSYSANNINFKILEYNHQNNKSSRERSNIKELLSLDFKYDKDGDLDE